MPAVTVISMSSSGEFSAAVTVVRAGLLVGKCFAYFLVGGGHVVSLGDRRRHRQHVLERRAGGG
jgi:hypothetical protein